LAAGGSFEVAYPVPAPISSGTYHISVVGMQSTMDAQTHADLVLRHLGAADVVLGSADGATTPDPANGILSPGDISADITTPDPVGAAGDVLVLHVKMDAGTGPYSEIVTTLRIP
jgi:hypothetical protein